MKSFYFLPLSLLLLGCSSPKWTVTADSSIAIAVDSTTDGIADSSYLAYLQPFKNQIDGQMNIVIGRAEQAMSTGKPESLLSNFSADVYRRAASDYLKTPVDIAIVNLGGLRTVIPAGNITVRKVFELMPFENELVILWLKGDKLNELLQFFASVGGEGEAGVRMKIVDGKAVDITVNNEPLDLQKTYTIATNDYCAGGNDKMYALAEYVKRTNTGIKIRNVLIDYIKNETANGRDIHSELDGRIK